MRWHLPVSRTHSLVGGGGCEAEGCWQSLPLLPWQPDIRQTESRQRLRAENSRGALLFPCSQETLNCPAVYHIPLWGGEKAGFAHKLTLTTLKQDLSQDHVVPDNGCLSTGHLLNPGFCCLVCFLFTRGTNTVSITATYYTITAW